MLNDIITEHKERMLNLKKYYPFFKLMDVSFAQFQEGRYEMLDMGYIVMGILRFFIEENNFKEKDVTYPEYLDFITSLLKRDFGLNLSAQEYKELADYIFDKIKNEGRPFTFPYYDPIEKKKCISRIKVLESAIRDHTVWYSISSDAIEFYLDTKEIKEESRISVQQLLLEKMIQAQNFQGGKDVIVRINEEVARLQRRKNEIMELLGKDVFAGIEAYEDFVHTGMRWFDEEEKLFKKNKDFIEGALAKMEAEPVLPYFKGDLRAGQPVTDSHDKARTAFIGMYTDAADDRRSRETGKTRTVKKPYPFWGASDRFNPQRQCGAVRTAFVAGITAAYKEAVYAGFT